MLNNKRSYKRDRYQFPATIASWAAFPGVVQRGSGKIVSIHAKEDTLAGTQPERTADTGRGAFDHDPLRRLHLHAYERSLLIRSLRCGTFAAGDRSRARH